MASEAMLTNLALLHWTIFLWNRLYINIETEQFAAVRSATFVSGVGMIFTLFIKAANRVL